MHKILYKQKSNSSSSVQSITDPNRQNSFPHVEHASSLCLSNDEFMTLAPPTAVCAEVNTYTCSANNRHLFYFLTASWPADPLNLPSLSSLSDVMVFLDYITWFSLPTFFQSKSNSLVDTNHHYWYENDQWHDPNDSSVWWLSDDDSLMTYLSHGRHN